MTNNDSTKINKDDVIAIATQDLKLASLLYDFVYPALYKDDIDDLPNEIRYHPGNIMDRPDDIGQKLIQEEFNTKTKPHLDNMLRILEGVIKGGGITFEEAINELNKTEPININYLNTFVRAVYEDLARDGVRSVPLFYNHSDYDDYFSMGDQDCLQIELFNYPLIETTDIEWKQVLEIRNDNKEFHKNIRDFRLFLFDNYKEQQTDYIYDDLMRKIDRYEEQCRENGIKLRNAKIMMLLDPSTYALSMTLSKLTLNISEPIAVTLAALIGASFDLGRMKMKIDNKKIKYDDKIQNPELGYLVELKKLES